MKLVVIGAQWGDEGKGKIVDFLADRADLVLRYSGGANAGHTVVIGEETFKFHLIPSGIVHPGKRVVLGIGMVIDPENLFAELEMLESRNIAWQDRIFLADRAHLVLPRYKELDRARDSARSEPLGTTGRGIGVTYAMKAHRDGIRVADLYDETAWQSLTDADRAFLDPYREKIRGMMRDVTVLLRESEGQNILFEGAQGTLLDLDLGTYPFVSSGMSCAAGAAIGGGVGPGAIDRVIGVFKAYSTRVGNGPFPTEFRSERDGALEEYIRETGREYGVTTGRPRRCGYLDLPALRYACRSNSLDGLVLTHLDVYDEVEEIKVCTAYRIDGETTENFPASSAALNRAQPVLESFPGWQQAIRECRSFAALPAQAREYIAFIEEYADTPVDIVSVGYRRRDTFIRNDPWTRS
jgi:adenylosuccinate synthase